VLTARLLPCDARAATSVAFVAQQVIVKVKREVKPDPLLSVKDGPSSNVKMGSNLRKMLLVSTLSWAPLVPQGSSNRCCYERRMRRWSCTRAWAS